MPGRLHSAAEVASHPPDPEGPEGLMDRPPRAGPAAKADAVGQTVEADGYMGQPRPPGENPRLKPGVRGWWVAGKPGPREIGPPLLLPPLV